MQLGDREKKTCQSFWNLPNLICLDHVFVSLHMGPIIKKWAFLVEEARLLIVSYHSSCPYFFVVNSVLLCIYDGVSYDHPKVFIPEEKNGPFDSKI